MRFTFIVLEIIKKIDDYSVDDLKAIDELIKKNKTEKLEPLDNTSLSNFYSSQIKQISTMAEFSYFLLSFDCIDLDSDDKIDKYKHLPLSCFDMIEVSWHFF